MQDALGLEIFLSIMKNIDEAPKSILENLNEVLEQAIRDKSGLSFYSRVSAKPETLQWYHKNYTNRPRDKPTATIGHLRLVTKPKDDT